MASPERYRPEAVGPTREVKVTGLYPTFRHQDLPVFAACTGLPFRSFTCQLAHLSACFC